jgi:hypothetical protein
MLSKLLCAVERHKPKRSHAVWDGAHFRTTCKACGSQVIRIASKRWRSAEPEPWEAVSGDPET